MPLLPYIHAITPIYTCHYSHIYMPLLPSIHAITPKYTCHYSHVYMPLLPYIYMPLLPYIYMPLLPYIYMPLLPYILPYIHAITPMYTCHYSHIYMPLLPYSIHESPRSRSIKVEPGKMEGFWSMLQTATTSTGGIFECWAASSLAPQTEENQSASSSSSLMFIGDLTYWCNTATNWNGVWIRIFACIQNNHKNQAKQINKLENIIKQIHKKCTFFIKFNNINIKCTSCVPW